jgi:3-methyladenine DNA glycosylase Tag
MMHFRTTFLIFTVTTCVSLAACGAAGPKRIDATTSSMRDTKLMLDRGAEQVTSVVTAAKAIESAQDRTGAFEDFSKAMDRLEADAKKAQSAWASLTSRTEEYVKAWEAESAALSSDASKQVAASRREAFASRFAALQSDLAGVKSSYGDLMTELSDIRILLANDLTQDGIDAVRPFIAAAEKSASTLQTNIGKLSAKLDREVSASSTLGPAPASAATSASTPAAK